MSCTADLCGGDDWQRPGYSAVLSEGWMVVVVVVETVVVVVVVVTVRVTAVVVLECSSGRRQRGLG